MLMLQPPHQPYRCSVIVVEVLYVVNEGKPCRGKKPASEETYVCAEWRDHATAEARMATR